MTNEELWTRRNARIEELVSQMTLEEKCSQLVHDAPAIPRLGLPAYNWWSEGLHGVGRNGRATVFPQAMNLAATFDRDLAKTEGSILGREARAKFNLARKAGWEGDQYRGLTFWSPNVNLFRDPRWGRGQETLGEDPFLSGEMGAAYVRGMQGDDPKNHMQVAACAKHYAVHSGPERDRHVFDAKPPKKDFRESYLPQFERVVKAGVESVMGAYNRTYGEPCCGSKLLLADVLRGEWGFDGHVVSDCWAVMDFWKNHKVCASPAESAALAIKNGCDLNCGVTFPSAVQAVRDGLLTEEDVDRALRRILRTRARLGLFDPPEEDPWKDLGADDVDTPEHRAVALRTARESVVLLKNAVPRALNGRGGSPDKEPGVPLLPLNAARTRHVHVIGPFAANLQALVGNYYGLSGRLVSVLEGIVQRAGEGPAAIKMSYSLGAYPDRSTGQTSFGEGWGADAIVACLGIDGTLEGEEGDAVDSDLNGDRLRIELPLAQEKLLQGLQKTGRPIVLVLFGGAPVAVDPSLADAILWVGYPGEEGGTAVADILFGDVAPSGHLPISWPKSTADLPPFDDYAMAGRTYKFAEKEFLWPFGFGLSYTTFEFGDVQGPKGQQGPEGQAASVPAVASVSFTVPVRNTGKRDGVCTVQVYVAKADRGPDDARCALVDFARVAVPAGGEALARFELPRETFATVDADGVRAVRPGRYVVTVADCAPVPCALAAGRTAPVSLDVEIR